MSLRGVIQQREALTIGQYTVLRMHTRKGRSAWVLSRNSYASGVIVQQLGLGGLRILSSACVNAWTGFLTSDFPYSMSECSFRFVGDADSL